MSEGEQRKIAVTAPVRFLVGRWNEARYGFAEGRSVRARVESLLGQEALDVSEANELSKLMMRARCGSKLYERMVEHWSDLAPGNIQARKEGWAFGQ